MTAMLSPGRATGTGSVVGRGVKMGLGRFTGAWQFRVELNRKRVDGVGGCDTSSFDSECLN